ncbi:MAG: pantoate--beta-alanine ligase, partial [bacterium]
EIITHPTVRDENGLALSSRHARLTSQGKKVAEVIYRALLAARDSQRPREAMARVLNGEPSFKVDYAEVIDESSFEILDESNQDRSIKKRALIAGWVEDVRLIDTLALKPTSRGER